MTSRAYTSSSFFPLANRVVYKAGAIICHSTIILEHISLSQELPLLVGECTGSRWSSPRVPPHFRLWDSSTRAYHYVPTTGPEDVFQTTIIKRIRLRSTTSTARPGSRRVVPPRDHFVPRSPLRPADRPVLSTTLRPHLTTSRYPRTAPQWPRPARRIVGRSPQSVPPVYPRTAPQWHSPARRTVCCRPRDVPPTYPRPPHRWHGSTRRIDRPSVPTGAGQPFT